METVGIKNTCWQVRLQTHGHALHVVASSPVPVLLSGARNGRADPMCQHNLRIMCSSGDKPRDALTVINCPLARQKREVLR